MSMEDGTLRRLELYLHDLHKKIDGIYDMLMLRHERETEQKGSSAINEKLLDNQDLCLLFQISPRSLQRYRSLGVLPYKRLGQKTYYTEEDVIVAGWSAEHHTHTNAVGTKLVNQIQWVW